MELTQNINNKTIDLQTVDFDPFAGPKLIKVVPTTQSQLEIWLSCIIGGDDANRSYNESISLKLNGNLNRQALRDAITELQHRHEILRSTFSSDGKSICIYEPFPVKQTYRDISGENPENRKHEIDKLHQADAELAFDLVHGPLLRTYLIKTSEQEHLLKISAHHIICDGWSFGILLENLSAIYNSLINEEKHTLEDPIPYSQYAHEIKQHTVSTDYLEMENYWLNQYKNDVPVLNLPTDHIRPQIRTFKSKRTDFQVPKSTIESLKSFGSKKKASLITTLIAAFESYLHLLTKQNDIVLGLPASGQSATGNYELVGHCVNLLPLRSKIKGDESFIDYLDKRKSEIMDAYDHQQFTFSSLLQKLNIARDSSRIPLVPVIFNVDMGMDANVSFSGLKHELFSDPRAYENFEIFLNITGTEQKLNFEWSHNALLFNRETIERMMGEFQSLLEQLIEDPTIQIKNIRISGNGPSLRDLNQWNNTAAVYPKNKTVADLINETAVKYPTKTAIFFNDREVTYTELNRKSNQLAHYLIGQGIQNDDVVALVADRSPEMIITLLGIIKSGATYLPIDPQYPEGRIHFMLEDSGAKHLFASKTYKNSFDSIIVNKLILEDILQEIQQMPGSYSSLDTTENRLAYILYTSGSTGQPKGVQIRHSSLTNFLLSVQDRPGIKANDTLLAVSTISFDIAATEILLPLTVGAAIYLADSQTTKDGRALLEIIQNKRISVMQATPITWRMMLAAGWNDRLPIKIICTGEAFPKDLAEVLLTKGDEVWNGYGPTETTIWSSIKQITNSNDIITIGTPLANTQMYILDEFQAAVPLGETGELYIAGDGLTIGYLNRPDLTDEKFIPNPFQQGTKIYRTGDLGYRLSNGEIVCLGRADAQVKIRGHRIELGEIEYNLSQQKGIKEAVVIADGDDRDNQQLLAYVVPDEKDSSGWMERWDDLYTLGIQSEKSVPLEEQNLDIAIISQYNTQEDIKEHGREWTQEGLKRIRALQAKKILELGTGGGHLLFELAPLVERYIATDYSEVAINKLNDKLALNKDKWKHVEAFKAPADDFSSIREKEFDLIFFHGVVQYFPTLEYLVKVLETAVSHLSDGGCIHIGDSQTLSAISMHFATEQLALLQGHVTVEDFEKIVKYQTEKEEEISIDPGFFYFLPQILPDITAVDVQIRGGDYSNEATKCHYDIWLYKGEKAPRNIKNNIIKSWNELGSIDRIDTLLSEKDDQVILVTDIPNLRVQKDYALNQLVKHATENDTVKYLKEKLDQLEPSGINPTSLWGLGEKRGFNAHIRWSNDGSDGNIEVVFIPEHLETCVPEQPSKLIITSEKEYLRVKKDTIDILKVPEHQINLWRNTLKTHLPEYMVPNMLIALNRFPTTENGKIDRKNLPTPETSLDKLQTDFCPPSSETETLVHNIWCRHLDLSSIDVNSNFFELGGHSLIAVRLMLDLEKETGIRLPISALFQNSTIAKLASYISEKNALQDQSLTYNQQSSEKAESSIKIVPSIEPQKEIWVACMLGEDSASKSYNISFSNRFTGSLNQFAMEKALQMLVDRHEALRATFSEDGSEMIINASQKVAYTFHDISDLAVNERNTFINNIIESNSDTAFDLSRGPLFKVNLIKERAHEHLLTITFHHIICDGYSSSLLMNELTEAYNCYAQNNAPKLPTQQLFSNYALAKHNFYQSSNYEKVQHFWTEQFKNEVPVLDIPTDFPRSKKRSYQGSREFYHIDKNVAERFKKIGFGVGCSSAIALRAVLEIFLNRISGQDTIISGLPTAGQLSESNSILVGHCVNLLPIKAEIDTHISFLEYLQLRRDDLLHAYDFSDLTFSSLVNKLNIARDPSRVPLTPVLLNIQSEPYDLQFHNLETKGIAQKKMYETFEIAINVDDLDSGMVFRWDYNTDLYKKETVQYFHQLFEYIMRQVSDNPTVFIKDLELYPLPSSFRANNIQPVKRSIYDLLRDSFNSFSSETAISFKKETLSYKALNERSNQLAYLLVEKGIREGDKIAIAIDRSIELIITIIAIVKAGAIYVPIDMTFPKDRIDKILKNAQPKFIVKSHKVTNIIDSGIQTYNLQDCMKSCKNLSKKDLDMQYHESNLIFILHTSGSTGQPKGVCMGQKAMANLLSWQAQNSVASQGTKTLQFSPITFDVSFQEIFSTLTTGGSLELITDGERLDSLALLEQITSKNIERIFLPFVALQALAENAVDTGRYPVKLREVMTAGEQLKITPQLIKFFSKIPAIKLFNQYGPTEAHVVTQLELTGDPRKWPTLPSIGKPINNTDILILDNQLKEVFPGVAGELCIAGVCLSSGYLNMKDITDEKFISWQIGNECQRVYRTGDLARYLPDGNIEYLGRIDNQVKIRGYRVELGEIEAQLNKIKEIAQAAVKVQEDEVGNKRLVAYYIINNTHESQKNISDQIKDWRSALKNNLPEYMIPHEYVKMEQMPKTPSGKIDRLALPPIVKFGNYNKAREIKKPKNQDEEFLLGIWEKTLGINNISTDDDFFELGGHSILAVKVILAIEKERGTRLPLAILFERPTIEKLASVIDGNPEKVSWNSLVTIKSTGSKTPIYLVHGLGLNVLIFESLARNMDPEQPIYALQGIGLDGNTDKLLYSIEELAAHYNSEIIKHNPDGPYIIGGYSLGGLLAYEMTRQLKVLGKKVEKLAIIDTYVGDRCKLTNGVSPGFFRRAFKKLSFYTNFVIKYPQNSLLRVKREINSAQSKVFKSNDNIEQFFSYGSEVNRSYEIAYATYKLQPMNVEVGLLKAKERGYYLDEPHYFGWKEFALGGVKTFDVSGNHHTCFNDVNSEKLASTLQRFISSS